MNTLKLITESGNEEAWLFADLFASLLMTIVLLVNVHTSQESPQATTSSGDEPQQTRLLFLHPDGRVSLDAIESASLTIEEAIAQFTDTKTQVEIVGAPNTNGYALYTAFSEFSKHDIQYVFTAMQ